MLSLIRRFAQVPALGLVVLAIALGSAASAATESAPDFPTFAISKTVWNARLSSFGPGTETFRIEYHTRFDWKVTQLSNSAQPRRAGTTWTYNGTLTKHDTYFGEDRVIPGPNILDNWIQPGLLPALAASGRATTLSAGVGQGHFVLTEPASGAASTGETDVTYDLQSGLPLRVEIRSGGKPVYIYTYQRN